MWASWRVGCKGFEDVFGVRHCEGLEGGRCLRGGRRKIVCV